MNSAIRHLRRVLTLVFAGLICVPGCALLQSLLGPVPTPSVSVSAVRITDFSLADLTLVFDVTITNPYAVPLPLVNIDYALASQAQAFLQGQLPLQGTIPVSGSKTVSLPAKVTFLELLRVLQGVRLGATIPYRASLGLSVNAPVLGALRLPIEKDGQLPIPAPPAVSVSSVTWQNITLAGATGLLKLRVANPNTFAFDVAALDYDFKLGGFDLARGGLTNAASVAAGGAQDLGINLSVSTAQAGLAILQLAQGSNSGSYSLSGALAIGTPFGPLRLPLALNGQVPFLR